MIGFNIVLKEQIMAGLKSYKKLKVLYLDLKMLTTGSLAMFF